MKIPRQLRILCAFTLVLLLSNVPHVALAEAAQAKMIPANIVVEELTREQAQANIDAFLKRDDVRKQLLAKGLTESEAKLRIASLSESELKQLSKQMDLARAGGDGGILIAILLIVLIIFLIKRI